MKWQNIFVGLAVLVSIYACARTKVVVGDTNYTHSTPPFEDEILLSFQLIDSEISVHDNANSILAEALAKLTYSNIGETNVVIPASIIYGHKSKGDNHIEVFDFQGQNRYVENEMDYDYVFDPLDTHPKEISLRPSRIQVDTIDLNAFYSFKHAGEYLIRFVDVKLGIQSNWDTLLVK